MNTKDSNIYIETGDGHQIKISSKFFDDSEYLNYMSELMGIEDYNEKIIIKIPNIDYESLNLTIFAYNSMETYLSSIELTDLVKILNTSNFLNINGLFLKTVEQIRNIIHITKNTETLRMILAEKNDFSHGEYNLITQKDNWCKPIQCHDTQGFINKLQTNT